MLNLYHTHASIYIPDEIEPQKALARTSHLCIAAHQDDIEIFAYHGIAECFRSAENWFTGITVTNGQGSPRTDVYQNVSDQEMQKIRELEQKKAAFIGEYSAQVQLGYQSTEIKNPGDKNIVNDLVQILEICQPHTIYLHNPADKHDTHVAVLLRSLEAIHQIPIKNRPKFAYGCEVWRSLDWMIEEDRKALAVDKYENIAQALVGIFDSQISGGKRYDTATMGRRKANATYLNPHETDQSDAVTWAMDLTPLILDSNISVEEYTLQYLENLKKDIITRIKKFK